MPKAYNIYPFIYFKKRYCRHCGSALKIKTASHTLPNDAAEYRSRYIRIDNHSNIEVVEQEYYCQHCDKSFSIPEQSIINKAQKLYKRKTLSQDEIEKFKK